MLLILHNNAQRFPLRVDSIEKNLDLEFEIWISDFPTKSKNPKPADFTYRNLSPGWTQEIQSWICETVLLTTQHIKI